MPILRDTLIIKTIYQSVEEGIELYGATKVDKTKLI